ncbi:MAG: hypothetical protein ABEJ64_04545 [Candidatus Nanohaloarchaea archaeon]
MKDRKIFYTVQNENLHKTGELHEISERELAASIIRSWMDSPGHRSTIVDRDRLYSDAGMGIACQGDVCYSTGVAAGMRKTSSNFLEEDYCWWIPAYSEGLGLSFPVNATINIKATDTLDAALASSDQSYEECIDGDNYDSIKEADNEKDIQFIHRLQPGNGVVINTHQGTNITAEIEYE